MAKYINKDMLMDDIVSIDISDCTDIDDIFTKVEETIDEQPTADVVEVVRCKDCQHCIDHACYLKNRTGKTNKNIHECSSNDFCSYGKRKEVANNG